MSFDSGKAPPDELDLLVGSTVAGKYHIDRLIGRGGMGAVFQATNAAIGKRVALKFLGASASRDSDAATRFQREAQAASLAESPHIVQIFDAGKSERGLPFLVMELLTGEDLRARLRREGRLDVDSAVRIAVDVLKALKQAHAAGIVHRDLKPDNVFLCRRDGEPSFVKLVDFGISKLQRRRDVDTITHEGAVLGTAFYMSPEQAQSFPDIDGRTDLFALGAILYEMLTGTPPHSAPTYEAVLIAICTRDAEDVRLKAPSVPPALARVIQKALSRKREERYQSADEMLADLERARALSELPAEGSRHSERGPSSDSGAGRRFQTLVFALVAALGGFAVAAYLVTHGGAAAEPEPLALPTPAPAATASMKAATPHEPAAAVTSPPSSIPPSAAKVTSTKNQDPKPPVKKPPPTGSAGVAGGLGLSTREP